LGDRWARWVEVGEVSEVGEVGAGEWDVWKLESAYEQ